MTEFWDKPAEKSGKVLAAFLEGLPLILATVNYQYLRHIIITQLIDHTGGQYTVLEAKC